MRFLADLDPAERLAVLRRYLGSNSPKGRDARGWMNYELIRHEVTRLERTVNRGI